MQSRKDKLAKLIVELPIVVENVKTSDLEKVIDYKSLLKSEDPFLKTIVYALENPLSNMKSTYDDFTKFINLL